MRRNLAMRNRSTIGVWLGVACLMVGDVAAFAIESEPPDPIVRLQIEGLSPSLPGSILGATLAFSSEQAIALCVCRAPTGCDLYLIRLTSHGPEIETRVATPKQTGIGGGVFAVAGGKLLGKSHNDHYLYSADLQHQQTLPFRLAPNPAPLSETVAGLGANGATIYRLTSEFEPVRQVRDEILAVSGNRVLFRQGDFVKIETLNGHLLGSFQIDPVAKCGILAEFVGSKNRVLLANCRGLNIIDFNGTKQLLLRAPPGWGHRHGWSADGRRLLFDQYTRSVSAYQSFVEFFSDLLTRSSGLGASDEQSNGETVQVVDTESGKNCFSWDGPHTPLGRAGEYHADLSPSGSLLAMVTKTSLLIYRLPTSCTGNQ